MEQLQEGILPVLYSSVFFVLFMYQGKVSPTFSSTTFRWMRGT